MIEQILCVVSFFVLFTQILSQDKSNDPSFDWLFIVAVLTLASLGILSFLLAWAGMYSGLLVSLIVIITIIFGYRSNEEIISVYSESLSKYSGLFRDLSKIEIFVSCMILFSFIGLVLPTNEDVTMNQDAYVYHSESQVIREHGSLQFDYDILDDISYDSKRNLFLRFNEEFGQDSNQAMKDENFPVMSPGPIYHGFLTEDLNGSEISHMYLGYLPSLQAFFSDAFGFDFSLNFFPLIISILTLVGFFLLLRTVFSKQIASIASVALIYNVPFVWYSKTLSSEMLVLLFVLCIALLASEKSRLKKLENSIVLGSMVGILGLVRFDSVFVWMGLLPAILMTINSTGEDRTRITLSSYFIVLGMCLLYWSTSANLYVNGLVSFTSEINTNFSSFFVLVAVCFIILGIGTISTDEPPIIQIASSMAPLSKYIFSILVFATPIVIIVGFVTYSDETAFNYFWNVTREVIAATSAPFVLFSLIGLTIMGASALINAEYLKLKLSNPFIIFVCSISVISAYYNFHLSNQPLYPWAFRRHIIGFMPALSVGLAVSIESFFSYVSRVETPVSEFLKVTFAAILLSSNVTSAEDLRGESNFDGVKDELDSYSDLFIDGSVIIDFNPFSHPSVCPYLTFHTSIDCLILWEPPSDNPDWKLLTDEINHLTKSRHVYLMNPTQDQITTIGWYLPLSPLQEIDLRTIPTDTIVWESHYSTPSFREVKKIFSTYKIETSGTQLSYNEINWSSPAPGMHFGFTEAIEVHNGNQFRWTGSEALLRFNGPFEEGYYNLTINLNAWRPDAAPNHDLQVYVNGDLVDTLSTVSSRPYHYQILLPEVTSEVIVGLELSTFKPSDFTSSGDRRDLGIRIYGAALNPVL